MRRFVARNGQNSRCQAECRVRVNNRPVVCDLVPCHACFLHIILRAMNETTSTSRLVHRFACVSILALSVTGMGASVSFAQSTDTVRPVARSVPNTQGADTLPISVTKPEQPETSQNTDLDPIDSGLSPAETSVAVSAADQSDATSHISGPVLASAITDIRPPARKAHVPKMRWQHMQDHALWTRAALSALKSHGSPLVEMVPRDIADWCPAYPSNDDAQRRAFWVGYMSALSKHESTYKPWAVGGGGRWYGLLQILPATARGYKCNVGTGEALKNGAANLSCGVRIMAYTVKRDGVIHGRDTKWRGVSADWGPMRSPSKRRDMASWLKRQNYCKLANSIRPLARP